MSGYFTQRAVSLVDLENLPTFVVLVNTINHVSNRNFLNKPPVADAILPFVGSVGKPSARVVYLFDIMPNHQKRDIFKLENGCWETNRKNLEIFIDGKTLSFKKFIYEQETGIKIPDGSRIKNTCSNQKCINPSHFRIITKEFYVEDEETGCWINTRISYSIRQNKQTINIVRYLYDKHIGKLEEDRLLTKTCKTPNCVNPHHYERKFKNPEYFIDENGCWVCTNRIVNHKYGYPSIYLNGTGKNIMLSKYNYIKKYGELPEGMEMRHKCDNKLCINPDHMEPGTHKQNMEDMANMGKAKRGTKSPFNKLTIEQAKIAKFGNGVSIEKLAIQFGVVPSTIHGIRKGKSWKWLKIDSVSE